MTKAATEYRYNRLTWPEMNDAIGMQKRIILPTGSTEQHGHHLPLDVDVFLAESVCLETGVHGDATKGTAEKGRVIFDAAVSGLVKLVDELREWPIEQRGDMHTHPTQSQIRW